MITTEELIKKVRCLINEAEADSDVSLITDDKRSLDKTIVELLPQAVALAQKNSNGGYVNVKALTKDNRRIEKSSDGFFAVVLPEGFVALVSLQLDSWKKPCSHIASPDSAKALNVCNNSAYGVFRPQCVEGVTEQGERVVKLFPCDAENSVMHFVYEAQFDADEGLGRCDEYMADAVAYICTSLLYSVFERYDAAKSFMSYAMALCGKNKNE